MFFDLNQEFEFSNFFPSEIPTQTENQVSRISTKSPYIWTYVDTESEISGYVACQTEVDTDKQKTVIYEGLKLIIPLVKYKEEDMQLLLASDIDGADGKKPELFDPISEEELEQVLNLIAEFPADEPFIYSQANSLGRDIGITRASPGEYAFPIIQINLEPGSREVNIDTKLRFQVDQTETDSFCSGIQPTSVEPTSVQPTSVQPTVVQTTLVKRTSVKTSSVKPTLVQRTSVKPSSIQPTSVEPTSVEPTSIQSTSTKQTVIQQTSYSQLPAWTATTDSSSLKSSKQLTRLARKADKCSPDVTSEEKMINDIRSRTQQMFPGKTLDLKFNGWSTGSIVCDYEIKFIEPLRTAAVSNKKE